MMLTMLNSVDKKMILTLLKSVDKKIFGSMSFKSEYGFEAQEV